MSFPTSAAKRIAGRIHANSGPESITGVLAGVGARFLTGVLLGGARSVWRWVRVATRRRVAHAGPPDRPGPAYLADLLTAVLPAPGLAYLAPFLAAALPATGLAQSSGDVEWSGGVQTQYQELSGDREAWRSYGLTLSRSADGLALVLEAAQSERFLASDQVFRLSAWPDLWEGGYGVIQLEGAVDPLFSPEAGGFVELYQSVGGGWELAGGYRLRRYPGETLHTLSAAAARYLGSWYLRARTMLVPRASELGISESVMARRYLGDADSYVQVGGGYGRGVEIVGAGPQIVLTENYEVSAAGRTFVHEHLGLSLTLMYGDTGFFTYRGASGGLHVRW